MIAIADCNSFYCSCERLFRPDLRGKPVVVLSNNDGCIISRTDEAKKLGIDMALPYFQCKQQMIENNVTTFSSNYHLYGDMSFRVMQTFRDFMGAHLVEVYSVDEAFINFDDVPSDQYRDTALKLKATVEKNTGIPICIGIAPNKLLSKIANKLSKKNKLESKGVMVLDSEESFYNALSKFPVEDIWGIGRQYAQKLKNFDIHNAWDLRNMPLEWARKQLGGVVGVRIMEQLKGKAISRMQAPRTEKKEIATTRSFGRSVTSLGEIEEAVATYAARAAEKLRRQYSTAGLISVFLVYKTATIEYNMASSSHYELMPVATSDTIFLTKSALAIARRIFVKGREYKKAGVIISNLIPGNAIQGNLFRPDQNNNKLLMNAIDNINFSMNPDMISLGSMGIKKHWKLRAELRSPRFTTHLEDLRILK